MNALFAFLTVIYPLLVYMSISNGYSSIAASAVAMILLIKGLSFARAQRLSVALTTVALVAIATLVGTLALKVPSLPLFYPVLVNLTLLSIFAGSLGGRVTIIERLAVMTHGPLPPEGSRYCRVVCKAWVAFIALNLLVSLDSTTRSIEWWSFYNGILSYLAIGAMALGEYVVRRRFLRRHGLLASLCIALSVVWTAHADSSLTVEQLRERLKPPTPFKSSVTERRYVAVLTSPLESVGEIACLPGEGIVWKTTSPVNQTNIITPRDVTIVDPTGNKRTVADEANISAALLSLMSGGVERASENFTLTAAGTPERWTITMTPLDSLVSEILMKIVVAGSSRPETIEIIHTNNDRIVQSFTAPLALSPSELKAAQDTLHEGS